MVNFLKWKKLEKWRLQCVQNQSYVCQCGAAKECGPRTPQQEKQQPHGVEAILKNHERTERYTSMICALVKIWHYCIQLVKTTTKVCAYPWKKIINHSAANAQKTFRDKPDSHLVEGKWNTMHLY